MCSKKQREEEDGAPIIRLSPFRPRRCLSRARSLATASSGGPQPLLSLALDALVRSLHHLPATGLSALPPDLSQMLLERLVACGRLDDSTIGKLSGHGLHFYSLPLGSYPEPVRPGWLNCLSTNSLEAADLTKAQDVDAVLACLGAPPHLTRLCLDYCVDLSDGCLSQLAGLTALQELSLVGCELLTEVGAQHLGGLTRLTSLSLQTCRHISLVPLSRLRQLERLDVGWCSGLGDSDAAVLARFTRLRELNLARTQVTDQGLAHLHRLSSIHTLSLAGTRVGDNALAALLCQLSHLQALNLERCTLAGDAALASLGQHASQLKELCLGYTAVSDGGLRHLSNLTQLQVLRLGTCLVGDQGLAVLSRLTQLRKLDISDTSASNDVMPAVAGMLQLECLNLSFTAVNDSGLKWLRGLAQLRCLNLDSRLFSDVGMLSLAQLTSLQCLDLFGARISDVGCASISKLTDLRQLEVCGGGLTDGGVAHLAALSRLEHLSVAQNYRVGNRCLPHLIKLNELTTLNLSQCRVTSNSVVALGCLPKLQTLALYETRVQPFAVDKLRAANPELVVQGAPGNSLRRL